MAATTRSRSRTRTATVVRYNCMEQDIPVFEPIAEELRQDCFEQTGVLLERFNNLWETLDSEEMSEGGIPSPVDLSKIGSALMIVGQIRHRLNDLWYLSEGKPGGGSSRQSQEQRQERSTTHEFPGGGDDSEGNPYR